VASYDYNARRLLQRAHIHRLAPDIWRTPPSGYTKPVPSVSAQTELEDETFEYDSAKKQYQMARALGHFPSECYLYLGENDIEQELFESAERHLRDALQEILKVKRTALPKARPDSSTNWWRTPQKSADGSDVPPGYFLLRVCLQLALVAAERAATSRARGENSALFIVI